MISLFRTITSLELAALAIMLVGYVLTGLDRPAELIASLGVGNIVAILIGIRHMVLDGDVVLSQSLIPGPSDVKFVISRILSFVR